MKTEISLVFRGKKEHIASILPPELTFLKEKLEDQKGYGCFAGPVASTEGQQQRIIEWGRTLDNGLTIIRSITINYHYERIDLTGLEIVQLFSTSLDETGTSNRRDAFFSRWQCPYCRRREWTQEKDILARPLPKTDFVLSDAEWEIIVSGRLHEKLKSIPNLQFRPLLNTTNKKAYVQVVVPQACEILLERSPVQVGQLCPVCRRYQVVLKEYLVEGKGSSIFYDYPGLAIRKDQPFSIHRPGEAITICRSPTAFGRFQPSEAPEGTSHVVGETIRGSGESGIVYFASAELVGHLLDVGMTGIGFYPANIVC